MDAANYLAGVILEKLITGKVLLLVPGGSAMQVAVKAAKIISGVGHADLAVTLTDERFGTPGHADSNWHQLLKLGFKLKNARLLPVLTGADIAKTTKKFNTMLGEELAGADYKIGLFGIGADSHTAGILPESAALDSRDWAVSYKTGKFERITITPETIKKLDEAVVYAQGPEKEKAIENLNKDLDPRKYPAQLLKEAKRLKIFHEN